jgi:hypothetical protein
LRTRAAAWRGSTIKHHGRGQDVINRGWRDHDGDHTSSGGGNRDGGGSAVTGSVWAIGDVHGQRQMLETLLELLPRAAHDITVFLGDYIDRGPDSAGVVRRALAEYDQAPERTVLLWGNHEDMAASHFGFAAPSGYQYDPYDWFRNGGIAALESFGHRRPELFRCPARPSSSACSVCSARSGAPPKMPTRRWPRTSGFTRACRPAKRPKRPGPTRCSGFATSF